METKKTKTATKQKATSGTGTGAKRPVSGQSAKKPELSSGAKKVENVANQTAQKENKKNQKTAKLLQKKRKEKERAKKRLDVALMKEERKKKKLELKEKRKADREKAKASRAQKKLEMKQARKQKKLEMKEKRKERADERKKRAGERRSARKKETKAQREKRLEKKRAMRAEERKARREEAARVRKEKREIKNKRRAERSRVRERNRKNRQKGYGGWLSAVVSLGAITLALTGALTYGIVNNNRTDDAMESFARGTFYELVGEIDGIDADLNKARIAVSEEGQTELLTDLYSSAMVAENTLEKFPADGHGSENVTAFLNTTAETSKRFLQKLSVGEELTKADLDELEALYQKSRQVRYELDEVSAKMTAKDFKAFLKGKKGKMTDLFERVEEITKDDVVGDEGPFADTAVKGDMISSEKAEEILLTYFKGYDVDKVDYEGETVCEDFSAYNFRLTLKDGRKIYAETSEQNGEMISFDSFEKCGDKVFDLDRSLAIAEQYLEAIGYENMTAVWANESGTQATFNFLYETNGTVFYPDSVKVRVCETKGLVVGFDATAFLKNHKTRKNVSATLTESQARKCLSDKLTVEGSRKAVIPTWRGEVLSYEFVCSYDENEYFVYIDAQTGEEVSILNVETSAQGRTIR